MGLSLAWATDPGLARENNEDSVFVSRDMGRLDALLVVADGMGGHASGQVASKLVADTVSDALSDAGEIGGEDLKALLAKVNATVYEASLATAENAGMGSTLVLAAIKTSSARAPSPRSTRTTAGPPSRLGPGSSPRTRSPTTRRSTASPVPSASGTTSRRSPTRSTSSVMTSSFSAATASRKPA